MLTRTRKYSIEQALLEIKIQEEKAGNGLMALLKKLHLAMDKF